MVAGKGAGLIHTVKPAAEVVTEICADAKRIISAVQDRAHFIPD